jgi:ATP phosphoribosyltransferase
MTQEQEPRLALAIQKSGGGGTGRLTNESVELLKGCDFKFSVTDRLDSTQITNYPMDILSLRSRDIPRVLQKGMVDLGIVGLDVVIESKVPLIRLMPLGYGKCRLALGVREDVEYKQPADLKNSIIATSYPNITDDFFKSKEIPIDLLYLEGSAELAGFRKWARGIIDVIESGSSMLTNGLNPKEVLFESEAWLVASPDLKQKSGSEKIVEEFLVRSLALLRPRLNRYIVINTPVGTENAVRDLIPGSLSPTVSPCVDPGWLDVSSVIPANPANDFWEMTEKLKSLGARDTIQLKMERMIPNKGDPEIVQIMAKIYA